MEWLENRGFEMTNIYVGNLSYHMTDDQLRDAFAAYGTVNSARIIMDRDTGRSKGFGFVEMEDDAQAQDAITKMDGQELDGRALKVNVARPREERPRRPSW
jgi:cold-inducible RNA-binding protein